MVDLKGMYQEKADELALDKYGVEFYDLPDNTQTTISNLAMELVNENLMANAESKLASLLLQNHKGKWCWVNPRDFCQEGFCSGCQIYNTRFTAVRK